MRQAARTYYDTLISSMSLILSLSVTLLILSLSPSSCHIRHSFLTSLSSRHLTSNLYLARFSLRIDID